MKGPQGERAALVGILLLALGLRAAGLPAGLPDLNRYFFDTDELGLMDVAMSMGGGDLNPRYYLHPSLLPYLLLGAYGVFYLAGRVVGFFQSPAEFAVFYWANKTPFHLIGRLVVVTFGVASVYLVYLIGRRAYGTAAGLAGGLFLAVAPLHVAYSQIIKTDVPSLFFGLLAVAAALRIIEGVAPRGALWAGIWGGLAAGTRYPSGLLLLAPTVALAWRAVRHREAGWGLLQRVTLLGLGAVGGFLAAMPYALLDFAAFRQGLSAVAKMVGSPVWLMYYRDGRPNWWVEHIAELWGSHGITQLLFAVGLAGVAWALWRREQADILLVLSAGAFYVVYSLPTWLYSPVQFLLPVVPLLAVLGGRALWEAAWRLGLARRTAGLAFLLLAVLPLWSSAEQSACAFHKRSTRRAREWVEANLPPGTGILMSGSHAPQLSFTPESLERWEAARRPAEGIVGFSRSRREQAVAGAEKARLLALRRDALTAPPQYDLYILPEEMAAPEWDYYHLGLAETARRYGVQYVITNTYDADRFTNDAFDPALIPSYSYADRRRFYREVEAVGRLVRGFTPGCKTDVGIRIHRIGS